MINTNDCYMKFRHEYEYVTNYDIDEIIFPRLHSTNSFEIIDKKDCHTIITNRYKS